MPDPVGSCCGTRYFAGAFAGSSAGAAALDDEELGALAPPLAEPDVLGCALEPEVLGCALVLELLESLGVLGALGALEPPEAEPDLPASIVTEVELDELFGASAAVPEGAAELLEDDAPGVAAEPVPPEELDEELGGVAGVALSVFAVLELEAPGADEVLLVGPLSQAARPKASATATASVESFM